MSIRLFERITTLVKADAHGVIESLEERTLLLKQYVREAELELNAKRVRLEALREEEKRLRESLARHEEEMRCLDDDVALALAGGKDDLARFAVRRLLARRSATKDLRQQIQARAEEGEALAARVGAQQAQFDDLRTRVCAELAREAAGATTPWPCDVAVADEEVEIELMRRRAAQGGAG